MSDWLIVLLTALGVAAVAGLSLLAADAMPRPGSEGRGHE